MDDGLFLVTRPKGIYKPAGLEYALSIRITLDSQYPDGEIETRADGSWFLSYHQERSDPAQRDREYANKALMACIHDAVPVGVLRQRPGPKSARPQYDVLGLAVPVDWRDGYFFFESVAGPQRPRGNTPSEVLERLADRQNEDAEQEAPAPGDDYDARLRVYRQIVARRGQAGFRQKLLTAYGATCAVTGCAISEVLEAAHLRPYRGPESHTTPNGLLLRADIHTLLDLQLLAFDPVTRRVLISQNLKHSQYQGLATAVLAEPLSGKQRPTQSTLAAVARDFLAAERLRGGVADV